MPAPDADLLFALLAVAEGDLDEEQFLKCAGLKAGFPALRLERLIADQNLLTASRSSELRAEADARLARHGGDAPRAIAALPLDADVRAMLVEAALGAAPPHRALPGTARGERYRLGAEIGRGGLGRVVEAFDRELKRDVAVKLVLADMAPGLVERFVREAELTARLEHPSIVPVHDFGTVAGENGAPCLFLAMKRIRGKDLKSLLKSVAAGAERGFTRFRLLRVFLDICLGVAYAHSRRILHRDLKPANVMIGDFGETLIVDWGLAKEIGEGPSGEGGRVSGERAPELTLDGAVVGTPAYMPPEQAQGRLADLDERSDVFALGGILYEILTLHPPYEGATQADVIRSAQESRVTPPTTRILESRTALDRAAPAALEDVPRELEAICLRALATEPRDRFPSALALHDAVLAYLDGEAERDRRRREALARAAAGRGHLERFRKLRAEVAGAEARRREREETIAPHEPLEAKRPLREAEAAVRRLREERIEALSKAQGEFGQALVVDAGCGEAEDGMCELLADRFLEAEERRDGEEMLLQRSLLAQHDRDGRHRARLDAPGTLTVRAWTYGCACLRPVRGKAWRVAFEEDWVAWRDGRPRPDLAVTDRDRPVPRTVVPAGLRFGHVPDCPRRAAAVEVAIERFEERDLRLVPVEERALGRAPLERVGIPQGSWRLRLRPDDPALVAPLVPVLVERGSTCDLDVLLWPREAVPVGFVPVPAGPFIYGGRAAGGGEPERRRTADFLAARAPVSCDEYLAFLNALPLEEARRRQPRDGDARYFRDANGRYEVRTGEPGAVAWRGDLPVPGISWRDAVAYCAWRSTKEGRVFRLLHDEEWEKAARGSDGRLYPWGDGYDGTFSNTVVSFRDGARLMPPGAFPADESPFGLLDMSGNIETWCWNAGEAPWRNWCNCRGGSFVNLHWSARAAARHGDVRDHVARNIGMRLAIAADA